MESISTQASQSDRRTRLPSWRGLLGLLLLPLSIALLSPQFHWWVDHTHSPFGADLIQEWTAGQLFMQGRTSDIYDTKSFAQAQHDPNEPLLRWDEDHYFMGVYPPAYYFWMSTLGKLPYGPLVFGWLLFSLICLSLALRWIVSHAQTLHIQWGFVGAVCFFPSVLINLTMGQKGLVWMAILTLSWYWLHRRKPWVAGALFGLLSIKPTLFFLLPILMLRSRQYRFAFGAAMTTMVLYGMAARWMPWDTWLAFSDVVMQSGSYHHQNGYDFSWSCNLLSLMAPLQHAGLSRGWAWVCLLPFIVTIGLPLVKRPLDWCEPEALLQALLATMLLSPHFYHYDLVLLLCCWALACTSLNFRRLQEWLPYGERYWRVHGAIHGCTSVRFLWCCSDFVCHATWMAAACPSGITEWQDIISESQITSPSQLLR
ncbi:MAG: glycosyltransferase family 87 protein [Pirellulales bacterium]